MSETYFFRNIHLILKLKYDIYYFEILLKKVLWQKKIWNDGFRFWKLKSTKKSFGSKYRLLKVSEM